MTLEIRKVTQKEFDAYWTPDVCDLLNKYIEKTKWWAINFDGPRPEKKWVLDAENGITFIGVNVMKEIEHPSQMVGQDVAVVSKNGSIGLLKHRFDESFNDIYEIIVLTGVFPKSVSNFKLMVLAAVGLGGLHLDGYLGFNGKLLSPLGERVSFINEGVAV